MPSGSRSSTGENPDQLQLPDWVTPPPERRHGAERRSIDRRAAPRPPGGDLPERRGNERRVAERRRAAAVRQPPGGAERRVLVFAAMLLLAYGLVMAYSASTAKAYFQYGSSFYLFERQAVYAVLGVGAMVLLSRVDYIWWRRLAVPLAVLVTLGLVAVLVPGVGSQINGARRWIIVGGQSVTPSEFAKLAAVMLVAALIVQRPWEVRSAGGFARLVAIGILPPAALIMLEPDLGTTLVLVIAVVAVLVAGGARLGHFVIFALAGALCVLALIVVEPYRMTRLTAFLHPWRDPQGSGMQTVQSLISIASGRLFGVGLGNSIQKFGFLPEQATDSITGIIGEEMGLVGLLALIGLYVLLAWACLRVALDCKERFGKLLAVGIATGIAGQALINIGAALGVLPLTGVPLPLVSLGGTSLVVVLAGIGIVLNIATNRRSHIVATPEGSDPPRGGRRDGRSHDPRARRR